MKLIPETAGGTTARGPSPPDRLVLGPAERREAVLEVIRAARQQLLLSLFRCTDYLIIDALAEAVERGVQVQALLTPRVKLLEARRLKELGVVLEGLGAQVHRYSDPIVKYHAKYVVADDGPALVASLNFTEKCFTNTCDFVLITHDQGVIGGLQKLFAMDSTSPEESLPPDLTERLIVGPDRSRPRLTTLLEQARRGVRIIDHKVTDPSIVALLREKKAASVAVEVLGSGGVGNLRPHGKMILVDDSVAVIGSIALAPMSLDFRREVAIVIEEPACLRQLNEFFQRMVNAPKSAPAPAGADEETEDED